MANKILINEIADLAAITKQVDTIVGQLDRVVTKIGEINKGQGGGQAATVTEATKAIQQQAKEQEKLNQLQTEAGAKQYQLSQAIKEKTKAEQESLKATNDQASAYSRLQAEAATATRNAREMAAQYGTASQQFKDASAKANDLNTKLKDIDAAMNLHQKNVGNYQGAFTSLRQEIKNATQTLAQMELQGKNNTQEYKNMVARLGELKDAVGDVQARSKFFADDARYINTAVQAVQGLVGAYSVYVGVTELVGEKNEELEKIMRKMMALMTVMQGLQQVANTLNKDSYVRVAATVAIDKIKVYWQQVSVVTTNAETGATQKATVAQIAYNVAKTASKGIVGLLIVAIAALVAGMVALTKIQDKRAAQVIKEEMYTEQQIESFKKLNEIRQKGQESVIKEIGNAQILFEALKKTKEGTNARKNAIDDVNKAYGQYLPNLLTEKSSLEDIANAQWLVVDAIKAKLKMEVATDIAKQYVERGAQLQSEKAMLEDQIKTINKYNKDLLDFNARAQAGVLKPFELAPQLPANIATMGTAFQALDKIEPKLSGVNAEINGNNSAMNSAIKAAADATAALDDLTYSHDKNSTATSKNTNESKSQIDFMKEWDELKKRNAESQKTMNDLIGVAPEKELTETEKELNKQLKELDGNLKKVHKTISDVPEDRMKVFKDFQKDLQGINDQIKNYGGNISNLIGGIVDLFDIKSENMIANIQRNASTQIDELQKMYDAGIISQTEFEGRKKLIQEKADADSLAQKKKQFEADKKAKLIQMGMDLASAQINIYATAGNIWAAIIQSALLGTLFTVNFEKVRNSQFSGYAKGRKGGPEEIAYTGEQGFEYISNSSGLFKTPNKATLTHLEAGAIVYPHNISLEIDRALKMPTVTKISKVQETPQNNEILNELRALNKKPITSINIDKNGLNYYVGKAGSWNKFVNNHIMGYK